MKMGGDYALLGAHHWVEKQQAVIFYHARPGAMRSWNRRAFEAFSTLTGLDSRFKSPRAHA
jgi:hypothetical protein